MSGVRARRAGALLGLVVTAPLAGLLGIVSCGLRGATHGQAAFVGYLLLPFVVFLAGTAVLLGFAFTRGAWVSRAAATMQLLVGIGVFAWLDSLLLAAVGFLMSGASAVLLWVGARERSGRP